MLNMNSRYTEFRKENKHSSFALIKYIKIKHFLLRGHILGFQNFYKAKSMAKKFLL